MTFPTLTVREHMTLQFAIAPYRHLARREADAYEQVGYTATRYWAAVNRLLDHPSAVAAYPADVHRLRRLRAARQKQRSQARRLEMTTSM